MAVGEADSLREQMSQARARIREMREMLLSANSLDAAADAEPGEGSVPVDRSALAPYLLALALDMCAANVPTERAADELVEVGRGSPMALLAARSLAASLHKELPDDKRARVVVDLLTLAVRRARVQAFGPEPLT
ncbi:MAG: hypothetical protein JWP02_1104 [Acidimicrobiales bacterium]|nr:hypothetical protein [Acidimicrobiales bacterium]